MNYLHPVLIRQRTIGLLLAMLAFAPTAHGQIPVPEVAAYSQPPGNYPFNDAGPSMEQVMARLERAEAALQAIQSQQFQPNYIVPQPQVTGQAYDATQVSAGAFSAEDLSLQDRIKSLEKSQKKADDAAAKKKADDAKKPTMKFNGRIHADYWAFPETSECV